VTEVISQEIVVRIMSEYPHLDLDRPKPRLKNHRIDVVQLHDMVKSIEGGLDEVACRYDLPAEAIEEGLQYYQEHEERLEALVEEEREDTKLALQLQEEGKI
jgi:uncharacterized protein (DUF433 family)